MTKKDPRPIAFRLSPELREELERRAEVRAVPISEIVRQLLERALADQDTPEGSAKMSDVESSIDNLGLVASQILNAVVKLGQQHRLVAEATLTNLSPDDSSSQITKWLEKRLTPLVEGGS